MAEKGPGAVIGKKNEPKTSLQEGKSLHYLTELGSIESAQEKLQEMAIEGWSHDEVDLFFEFAIHEAIMNAIAANLGITKKEGENLGLLINRELEKNPGKRNEKEVHITPNEMTKDRISITIRDEGSGFDWRNVPDPTNPETKAKTMKGRGVFIQRAFSDSATHNEKGNEVTLVKERIK